MPPVKQTRKATPAPVKAELPPTTKEELRARLMSAFKAAFDEPEDSNTTFVVEHEPEPPRRPRIKVAPTATQQVPGGGGAGVGAAVATHPKQVTSKSQVAPKGRGPVGSNTAKETMMAPQQLKARIPAERQTISGALGKLEKALAKLQMDEDSQKTAPALAAAVTGPSKPRGGRSARPPPPPPELSPVLVVDDEVHMVGVKTRKKTTALQLKNTAAATATVQKQERKEKPLPSPNKYQLRSHCPSKENCRCNGGPHL